MKKVKILGFTVSKSKSDRIITSIFFEYPHDAYRQENALICEGNACDSEYLYQDLSEILSVGQLVGLYYDKTANGKAYLSDVIPLDKK